MQAVASLHHVAVVAFNSLLDPSLNVAQTAARISIEVVLKLLLILVKQVLFSNLPILIKLLHETHKA